MADKKHRKILFTVAFAALLLLASMILFEVFLRTCSFLLPEPIRSTVEEAGRTSLCNTRMFDGTAILLPKLKEAQVVVVGDSFPFGTYVRANNTFPAQLAEQTGLTVANLGVGSTAPPEYNRMAEVGMRYSPSLLVYCLFANDFNVGPCPEGGRELKSENAGKHHPGDVRLFRREKTIQMRLQIFRKNLTNLSLLLQLAKLRRQPIFQNRDQVPQRVNGHYFVFAGTNYWESQVSWDEPSARASTESNIALIQRVNELAAKSQCSLLVVLIPSKEMVYGPLTEAGTRIYSALHHRTYQELESRLEAVGIPCLDLTPQLRASAKSGAPLFLSIDGHLDENGHRRVALVLAEYLSKNPKLSPPNGDKVACVKGKRA